VELAVLVQPVEGNGYRAWCSDPLAASAEGATREEALSRLREVIEQQFRGGVEVVRLHIGGVFPRTATPIWPDDQITQDWLAGIAAARAAADQKPDPWDEQPGADQP
jgi:predicted RNase H-like HicB family nuclease